MHRGYPAFGYQKGPEDRHHRISNEFAPVVKRRMLQMALESVSCYHIAKTLEAEQVPTLRAYICDKHGKYVTNAMVEHPYAWIRGTVYKILSNLICLSNLVSYRCQTRLFT